MDIDRTHIHIVSTCVGIDGKKIPDDYDHPRSMAICRDLEIRYNLNKATEKEHKQADRIFKPVNHKNGDIKSQIASIVRHLPKYYSYSTIGSYNALLSLSNITAEEVKGERNGQTVNGLVYVALDENGNKASNPFKASLFGKDAGVTAEIDNTKETGSVMVQGQEWTARAEKDSEVYPEGTRVRIRARISAARSSCLNRTTACF